jgi:asparagine synthase (glutamine-hydrolysing)
MCGLAGILVPNLHIPRKECERRLDAMARSLAHRGPDASGTWLEHIGGRGTIGFGHTRLSILDIRPDANQPMISADGRAVIVFNGEIYNFQELRAELETFGHNFRTKSDTEVILAGYLEFGDAVVERLDGMFALAIWDARKQTLLLARDRFGKKPLYLWNGPDGRIAFGSEIKAILTWPEVPREPDYLSLHHFLTFQYVPGPRTAFRGICSVPPAHKMVFDGNGKLLSQDHYWSLPEPDSARPKGRKALAGEFRELFVEAVRKRLIADVPIGTFLSGGVDSSCVSAVAFDLAGTSLNTFNIGFDEKEVDESSYARTVADHLGAPLHSALLGAKDLELLPRLAWHYDQPFADPSALPTYRLCELARQKVKVAISGDGADEVFMGYNRYAAVQHWQRHQRRPAWQKRLIALAGRQSGSALKKSPFLGRLHRKCARADSLINTLPEKHYADRYIYFKDHEKDDGYGEILRPYLDTSSIDLLAPYFGETSNALSGASWADLHHYLIDDILVKVDVASMAHGLEVRSPFLDTALVEWAVALPASSKVWGNELKALLKSSVSDLVPKDILARRKMGFGLPLNDWTQKEPMRAIVSELLQTQRFAERGILEGPFVDKLISGVETNSGTRRYGNHLWALSMLELWFRTWIDQDEPSPVTI